MIALAVLVWILGLAIGSFLNVVVYRLPRHESLLFPASHCPQCGGAIAARHNVPIVGWLVLRGRCASCSAPISARYPLVEAVTGVGFGATALALGVSPWLGVALALITVAIPAVLITVDGLRGRRSAPHDDDDSRAATAHDGVRHADQNESRSPSA